MNDERLPGLRESGVEVDTSSFIPTPRVDITPAGAFRHRYRQSNGREYVGGWLTPRQIAKGYRLVLRWKLRRLRRWLFA